MFRVRALYRAKQIWLRNIGYFLAYKHLPPLYSINKDLEMIICCFFKSFKTGYSPGLNYVPLCLLIIEEGAYSSLTTKLIRQQVFCVKFFTVSQKVEQN